jgi:hypothetical protein
MICFRCKRRCDGGWTPCISAIHDPWPSRTDAADERVPTMDAITLVLSAVEGRSFLIANEEP